MSVNCRGKVFGSLGCLEEEEKEEAEKEEEEESCQEKKKKKKRKRKKKKEFGCLIERRACYKDVR